MDIKLYCNTDAEGYITSSLAGNRVIPMETYNYFFLFKNTDVEKVNENIPRYRVVNEELVPMI